VDDFVIHGFMMSPPAPAARPGTFQSRLVRAGSLTLDDGSVVPMDDVLLALVNARLSAGWYVTPEEASQLLGVSRPTVYKWQESGSLGCVMMGNRRMIPRTDVDRLVAAAATRAESDRITALVEEDAEPLDQTSYLVALQEARQTGGPAEMKRVRERQQAARAAAAARRAHEVAGSSR